jgi:hypothetical protein
MRINSLTLLYAFYFLISMLVKCSQAISPPRGQFRNGLIQYGVPEIPVVFGNAFVVEEKELAMVMREMVNKYFPDKVEAGEKIIEQYKSQCAVVRIETTHITGKRKV